MSTEVTLKIDMKLGLVEVSAPPDHFEKAMEQARITMNTFNSRGFGAGSEKGDSTAPLESGEPVGVIPPDQDKNTTKKRAIRQTGGSSGRAGRIGSFEPVNFGMEEQQERALRNLYSEKKPEAQNEQVAVAMYQGEKAVGRKEFSYNEIYSLLRLSGETKLPKALDVIIGQMLRDNWVQREGANFQLKFVGRDYVEQKLPQKVG